MMPARALLLTLVVGLAACTTTKPAPPDEATLRAEDRRALEELVAIDVKVSQAMRDADTATGAGDGGAAGSIVAGRARPAADEAVAAAGRAAMKTPWGEAKKAELVAILRDRQAEMPRYEEAVKGDDPEKMLAAIEGQAAIERRALATVAALREGR
ncbi:MAG: hypothetical protein JWP97_1206 [Labilithrix sp.]|nr:hypothetical protein [Labilithrix sp.]